MHRRGLTPPALFWASVASPVDVAPIGMLPPEMIAHVLARLALVDKGDLWVCACILASRLFHVLDRQTLWRHGARLRRLSLAPDRLARLGFVPVLCRFLRRRVLTSRALVEAAACGRTDAVRFLCDVARLTDRTKDALGVAIDKAHPRTVAYLLARAPRDARLARALVTGAFCHTLLDRVWAAVGRPAAHLADKWAVARLVCEAVRRLPGGDAALYAMPATACAVLSRTEGALDWLADVGALDPNTALDAAVAASDPAMADRALDLVCATARPHAGPPKIRRLPLSSLALPIAGWCAARQAALHVNWAMIALTAVEGARYDVLDFVIGHARTAVSEELGRDVASYQTRAESYLADHLLHPDDSMITLERAMMAGDRIAATAICARRHALGLPCKVGRIYGNGGLWWSREPANRGSSYPRAFDLSMARAVGIGACGTEDYATSAADTGAVATLDWVLAHSDTTVGFQIWQWEFDADLIGVLVRHRRLGRHVDALVHLVRGHHWDHVERFCKAYPHMVARAAQALLADAMRTADLSLVESAARIPSVTIGTREMDMAASHAPLDVVMGMARRWGARCSARGVMGAVRRLHGAVLAGLLDDEPGLCAPDAFDVHSATQRRAWKKNLASAAAAGFVDNAERVRMHLGLAPYGAMAMNEAAAENNLAALAALHALGVGFTPRAFTRAIGRGHIEAVDFLLATRSTAPSTFALVMAIQRGHLEIARRLLAHNKCPYSHAALIAAALHARVEIIPLLLARYPPTRRTLAKAIRGARGAQTGKQKGQPGLDVVVEMLSRY